MAVLDTGGFAFAFELSQQAVSRLVTGRVYPASSAIPFSYDGIEGVFFLAMDIRAARVSGLNDLVLTIGLERSPGPVTGGVLVHRAILGPGVPDPPNPNATSKPMRGTATVRAKIVPRGTALRFEFPAGLELDPAEQAIDLGTVVADDFTILAEITRCTHLDPQLTPDSLRRRALGAITTALLRAIAAHLRGLGEEELIPAPVLPLPLPVARVNFLVRSDTLVVFYDACGTTGATGPATRPNLLRAGNGAAVDVTSVAIDNATLLGCIFGPTLAAPPPSPTTPPLPASFPPIGGGPTFVPYLLPALVPRHPFLFSGRTPLTLPVASPPPPPARAPNPLLPAPFSLLVPAQTLTTMLACTDGTGLRVALSFEAAGPEGAFSIRVTAEQTYAVTARVITNAVIIATAASGSPRVVVDVVIEPWCYVFLIYAAAFIGLGAVLGVLVELLLIDTTTGEGLAPRIRTLLGPVFAAMTPAPAMVALPAGTRTGENVRLPPNFAQVESPTRTVTIVGGALAPLHTDPFLAHDLIINVA